MTHIIMMETKKRKRTPSEGAAGDGYEGGDVGTQGQGAEDPIPLDSLASIRQLKNAMMKEKDANICPFVLQSQLYTVMKDKTNADRELEVLRDSNTVRVFNLPSGENDVGVMETKEYLQLVSMCRAEAVNCSDVGHMSVFDWFVQDVLPRCRAPTVSHGDLERHLSSPIGSTIRRAVTEKHIDVLIRFSLLRRESPGWFAFAIPYAGRAINSIVKGRRELVGLVKRRRFGEILLSKAESIRLKRSILSTQFHLKDLIGSGELESTDTTVGPVLRLST